MGLAVNSVEVQKRDSKSHKWRPAWVGLRRAFEGLGRFPESEEESAPGVSGANLSEVRQEEGGRIVACMKNNEKSSAN